MTAGLTTFSWNNNLKSFVLLAAYPFIILAVVWSISYAVGLNRHGPYIGLRADGRYSGGILDPLSFANHTVIAYWPTILTVIAIWFMISYVWNTAMIRALAKAKNVTREDEPLLYNLIENLCISRGLSVPHINIVETDAMNAFASGINEKSYTITVTRGLLEILQKDELEAVLGHELSHILNNDARLMMITVIFTGIVGFLAQLIWSNIRYGFYFSGGGNGRDKAGGLFLLLAVAVILWVGYMATLFTRFAISRRREYMADAGSVELTKNPDAMMRALMRIAGRSTMPHTTADITMMCIENERPFFGVFATHPKIEDRVRVLSELTHTPIPVISEDQPPIIRATGKKLNPWLRNRRN